MTTIDRQLLKIGIGILVLLHYWVVGFVAIMPFVALVYGAKLAALGLGIFAGYKITTPFPCPLTVVQAHYEELLGIKPTKHFIGKWVFHGFSSWRDLWNG